MSHTSSHSTVLIASHALNQCLWSKIPSQQTQLTFPTTPSFCFSTKILQSSHSLGYGLSQQEESDSYFRKRWVFVFSGMLPLDQLLSASQFLSLLLFLISPCVSAKPPADRGWAERGGRGLKTWSTELARGWIRKNTDGWGTLMPFHC